ncbi:MAG TPA: hypothetical protein VF535_15400 [Allosphingosinicella sp.]|jgi:hypothetical protein
MAWLALGALLLLLAVPGGSGKPSRPDGIGLAAIAAFSSAAWRAVSMYPTAKVAAIMLAWAAALGLVLVLAPGRAPPPWGRLALLALGAASILFALFGPADGLF